MSDTRYSYETKSKKNQEEPKKMRNHMASGWFYSRDQIRRFLSTRITSLRPPRGKLRNLARVLGELSRHQWLMFAAGFSGWTWDAFDFATVLLCVTEIAAEFSTSNAAVSWGITITLMLRPVGAFVFGGLADRYGRKWIMITNLGLFIVLELASGFTRNLKQFLAVRALYGVAMGGLYGPAAATALEDLPYDARGLLSGVYQGGYPFGYTLAAVFYRALVPTTTYGWRSLFWFGSIPPVFIIAFRWWLPDTNVSQVMRAEREAKMAQRQGQNVNLPANISGGGAKAWLQEVGTSLRENWFLFTYMVVLMTGFNSCSHGSADLYPTFLKTQVELGPSDVTIITVIGQIGSIVGGTIVGYASSFLGRRLSMMACCILGAAVIPAYVFSRTTSSLAASAFVMQLFVGGVWGPVPIHLTELSPPVLRTTAMGLTHQLGNLASSATATIQATIGERFPLAPTREGVRRYDYGRVIAVFLAAVWVYMLLFLILGPEMSQKERAEFAAEVDRIEEMRRAGFSLAEIGAQNAGLTSSSSAGEKSPPQLTNSEKRMDVEHVE